MVDLGPPSFDVPLGRWWAADESCLAEQVVAAYRKIRDDDGTRLAMNDHHARLYGGPRSPDVHLFDEERISLNVIKNAIDAVTAKIGKQRPAPEPLTSGGNPSLRKKARLLKRFLEAQFDCSELYQEMPRVMLDACVFGTGLAQLFTEDGEIRLDRVHPSEVFVAEHDGLYGKPQAMLKRRWVARDVLCEMFPEHEDIIRLANRDDAGDIPDATDMYYDPTSDQVMVVEGWHLRSGKKAKDGRHVICLDSGTLLDEEWEHPWHPFLIVTWNERLRGFWGQGIAEELNGIQVEINTLLQKIQASFHLASVPRVFVDQASKIQKAHFDNRIGAIIPYVGKPPVVMVPQVVHPEVFAHLDRLYTRAFEIVGVSQLAARQDNPLGADASGVALQTWHDMETERFSIQAAKFEQTVLVAAKMMIAYAKGMGGNYAAPAQRDRNTVERIHWSDIDMEDDEYVLRVQPSSSLPSTPAGRLRTVIYMLNAGIVQLPQAQSLLAFPDLEAHLSLDRAAEELLEVAFEKMLDDGVYVRPEPFMDLQLGLKMAQAWYNRAMSWGVEEERLELLRKFMRQTNTLLQAAQVEQMKVAAQAAGMNAPQSPAAVPAPGPNGQPPMAVTPDDGGMRGR